MVVAVDGVAVGLAAVAFLWVAVVDVEVVVVPSVVVGIGVVVVPSLWLVGRQEAFLGGRSPGTCRSAYRGHSCCVCSHLRDDTHGCLADGYCQYSLARGHLKYQLGDIAVFETAEPRFHGRFV